ncbi:hypothetical protein ACJU26_09080 [Acidithiobacillus sp. M4-SHS-6]|uniref:hypothetical protein n=1 Tax=Acidithiobacillus sp. M4-SHS-6 TaxID=3383024 RepID=UPI0039BEA534
MEIPDFGNLCGLFLQENAAPDNYPERWVMQWYRETFAPDCGIPWLPRLLVWSGWASWWSVLALACVGTLFFFGWLPGFFPVIGAAALIAVSASLFLLLLGVENWQLHRKGIPLNVQIRRHRWLQSHPVPETFQGSYPKKLPWWFWLDGGFSNTLTRVLVFIGAFAIPMLVVLCGYRVINPELVTWSSISDALFCWGMVLLWFPVPFSVWLSHLDWTHRDREVLLAWAARVQPVSRGS